MQIEGDIRGKDKSINMLEGPVLRNIFIYTIPIILTGVIQLLFNAAGLAVLVVMHLMRRTDGCKLILSKIRIYKPQLQKIILIGVPAGLQNALFPISNIV